MPYIARDVDTLMATTVGWVGVGQEGAALTRAWTAAPPATLWRAGAPVRNNSTIEKGTVIATFEHGQYNGHAALYLGETAEGIVVFDQGASQHAHERTIHYGGRHAPLDNGDSYFVVE